ncbi:MAG TPA: hypothetical protein IAA30_04680 [Candidatus Treponema faecavium]|nr:hypothetical protein [Candidatus Treponema faecavium]
MDKFPLEKTEQGLESVPVWEQARACIVPYLEPAHSAKEYVPALRSSDSLVGMITNKIKMYIAVICKGIIVPLSEAILRTWDVTWKTVRLAMDENMARLSELITYEEHTSPRGFAYMSLHHPVPAYTSSLAFYKPFRDKMCRYWGGSYYMAAPERSTVVLFGKEELPKYVGSFRDDVLLTYDCSMRPLSGELLEVSPQGIVTLLD